ncbi:hypothetical protein SDC9_05961 [bioreactor metagenome]|uniref:Uncharacterized protein n=1 Tax=bioreactor metagenome TaxID=1076179 RepID=A0A644T0C6_9ZZZZ|nr:YraN family protein [Negativicutes bacterium]
MNHIKVGNIGEQAAADLFQQAGYTILAKKFRSRTGEIDIIAKHRGTIVFVEVKTRRSTSFGFPAEAVTYTKQQKIIKTALCYLNMIQQPDSSCRFDVVEVFLLPDGNFNYNHIINAFGR